MTDAERLAADILSGPEKPARIAKDEREAGAEQPRSRYGENEHSETFRRTMRGGPAEKVQPGHKFAHGNAFDEFAGDIKDRLHSGPRQQGSRFDTPTSKPNGEFADVFGTGPAQPTREQLKTELAQLIKQYDAIAEDEAKNAEAERLLERAQELTDQIEEMGDDEEEEEDDDD